MHDRAQAQVWNLKLMLHATIFSDDFSRYGLAVANTCYTSRFFRATFSRIYHVTRDVYSRFFRNQLPIQSRAFWRIKTNMAEVLREKSTAKLLHASIFWIFVIWCCKFLPKANQKLATSSHIRKSANVAYYLFYVIYL